MLLAAYMRLASIDFYNDNISYEESQERLRIGREMFEDFKEEHPYDYAERIASGNIGDEVEPERIPAMTAGNNVPVPSSPADAGVKEGEKEKTTDGMQTVELKRETEQGTGQGVSVRPRAYGAASAAERARQKLIERLKKDRSGLGDISLR